MVEVTKSNFKDIFPSVVKSIKKCSFICIDAEFTGLYLDADNNASLFDSLEERYLKLKERASSFIPCQIGISTYTKCADKNEYSVETYIFYVRPHMCGSNDRRFMSQASSFDFLSQYNFDYDKFLRDGIPYLNEEEEKQFYKELSDKTLFYPHIKMLEISFKKQLMDVSRFIRSPANEDTMTVAKIPSNLNYFQLHCIREQDKSIWAYSEEDSIKVIKVSPEQRKELERSELDELKSLHNYFLGFTTVFRILKEAKKPIVGHNLLMDLLLIFHNFHKQLPKSFQAFKKELHTIFPVIYDTRYIWMHVLKYYKLGKLSKESGLFELYDMFQRPPDNLKTIFPPAVELTEGNKHFMKRHPHNSGFDSYVTGWVFLRICHLLAMNKIENLNLIQPQSLKEHLKAVSPFVNKINLARTTIRYVDLDGNEIYEVPNFIHIEVKNKSLSLSEAQLGHLFKKYGAPEFRLMRSKKGAVIAVGNIACYNRILKDFEGHPEFKLEKYSTLLHSWPARVSLGLAGIGSMCIIAFLVVKLIQ